MSAEEVLVSPLPLPLPSPEPLAAPPPLLDWPSAVATSVLPPPPYLGPWYWLGSNNLTQS